MCDPSTLIFTQVTYHRLPDERVRERQKRAQPPPDELQHWLTVTPGCIPGRDDLAATIRYALSQGRRSPDTSPTVARSTTSLYAW